MFLIDIVLYLTNGKCGMYPLRKLCGQLQSNPVPVFRPDEAG